MQVSVIIPTYNGKNKILNIIQALEKQSFQDFETIIMIDGSPDNTEKVIDNYSHSLKKLQVINQVNQGRGKVRNDGVKYSTGELLIFFDDDMRPLPNCIEKHIHFYKQHSNSVIVGGLGEDINIMNSDIQKYKAVLSQQWTIDLQKWKEPLVKNNLFVTAANLAISKNTFNSLEGFDSRLNDCEDWDLGVRAFKENISIYYYHEAFAWHDDFITCKSYIKRQKEYKKFHQKLLKLKPELYKEYSERTSTQPTGIKKLVFQLFKNNFWVWSIDHFNWLKILPKPIRYKIYDLVITSHFL
ncbi:MAG: glycosyltransferase family 2 protein [Cytophagales bacterium]|nr:glycosyltransferase family 2 protein [Cytophagales bacterium]